MPGYRLIFLLALYTICLVAHESECTTNNGTDVMTTQLSVNTSVQCNDNDFFDPINDTVCVKENSTAKPFTRHASDIQNLITRVKKLKVYVDPVIYAVGFFLTLLGLFVFINNERKDKASSFIVMFLLNNIFLITLDALVYALIEAKFNDLNATMAVILKWVTLVSNQSIALALKSVSNALYAVMSINCFVAVAFPFYMNRFIVSQNPRRLILILLVFNIIYFSFNLTRFRYSLILDKTTGKMSLRLGYTDFALNNTNFFNIYGFIGILMVYLIPIPTTVVFFVLTLVFLKRSANSKAICENDQLRRTKFNHTRRLTKIFMMISFVQILVGMPFAAVLLLVKIDPDYKMGGARADYIALIVQFILSFEGTKHGIVCIIFLAMSESFRQRFKTLFNL